MAFKSVVSHTNCVESSERCKNNPVSCVPEHVRSRIASLVSRNDFHFVEEDKKHSLPYGCYLSPVPKVPYDNDCYPCAHFCRLTEKPVEEDTETTREMCQLYCWEDRVRCTTTPATTDAKTKTMGSSLLPEPTTASPLQQPPSLQTVALHDLDSKSTTTGEKQHTVEDSKLKDSSWRAWEKKVPQVVPWSALVIGLTTLIGYLGFLVYLCISDWWRR